MEHEFIRLGIYHFFVIAPFRTNAKCLIEQDGTWNNDRGRKRPYPTKGDRFIQHEASYCATQQTKESAPIHSDMLTG